MNLKETYNKIARDWHKDHQADDWWVEGVDTFIAQLSAGSSVLDAGCGAGTKTQYLLDKGLRVTGIDFSEEMIAIAKKEIKGAQFKVLDLRDISTLSESYDGIFAQASLLHIPHAEVGKVIEGVYRKLKHNGLFYIAVKKKRKDGVSEEILQENDYGYAYKRFFSYFTLEELKEHFEDLGLEVLYERETNLGRTVWIQMIGRK